MATLATGKQVRKVIEKLEGLTTEQLNDIIGSGIIDDAASGNFLFWCLRNRNAVRKILGQNVLDGGGTATFTVDTSDPGLSKSSKEEKNWLSVNNRQLGEVEVRFREGEMRIDGVMVLEYFSPEQEDRGLIKGNDLRKLRIEDTERPDLPDAILDLVLQNQDNPAVKAWLRRYPRHSPFFGATEYVWRNGTMVRCLWGGCREWEWKWERFDDGCFYRRNPFLVLERPLAA